MVSVRPLRKCISHSRVVDAFYAHVNRLFEIIAESPSETEPQNPPVFAPERPRERASDRTDIRLRNCGETK